MLSILISQSVSISVGNSASILAALIDLVALFEGLSVIRSHQEGTQQPVWSTLMPFLIILVAAAILIIFSQIFRSWGF
jgi:hypothetical protein